MTWPGMAKSTLAIKWSAFATCFRAYKFFVADYFIKVCPFFSLV